MKDNVNVLLFLPLMQIVATYLKGMANVLQYTPILNLRGHMSLEMESDFLKNSST